MRDDGPTAERYGVASGVEREALEHEELQAAKKGLRDAAWYLGLAAVMGVVAYILPFGVWPAALGLFALLLSLYGVPAAYYHATSLLVFLRPERRGLLQVVAVAVAWAMPASLFAAMADSSLGDLVRAERFGWERAAIAGMLGWASFHLTQSIQPVLPARPFLVAVGAVGFLCWLLTGSAEWQPSAAARDDRVYLNFVTYSAIAFAGAGLALGSERLAARRAVAWRREEAIERAPVLERENLRLRALLGRLADDLERMARDDGTPSRTMPLREWAERIRRAVAEEA